MNSLSMNLLNQSLHRKNLGRPPVWFMRQAGRYHQHYQKFRQKYSFIDLCKLPEIACAVTLGPIEDFDFDAAILFSDLLFPLEAMGMGLSYPGKPQLSFHIREKADLSRLLSGKSLVNQLEFQGRALELIRKRLPPEKALLGFVGGPLTLFCYAVEGSHQGQLDSAKRGLVDGRFLGFFEKLYELLVENMVLQAQSGADVIAVLDTCVGEFNQSEYQQWVVPCLKQVLDQFQGRCPGFPVLYYSKGTGPEHWVALKDLPIAGLGIDWKQDLVHVLKDYGNRWAIQGNVDPHWLLLEREVLEPKLRHFFKSLQQVSPMLRQGWICGLGHGVLPQTPETNVRLFLELQKSYF